MKGVFGIDAGNFSDLLVGLECWPRKHYFKLPLFTGEARTLALTAPSPPSVTLYDIGPLSFVNTQHLHPPTQRGAFRNKISY